MFSVREAWHNIGVRVEKEVTAKEAIELAKLDYNIIKLPLYVNHNNEFIKSEEFYGNFNSANNKLLGTVTDRYKIVQNTEAFEFFDSVVKSGEAIYHSAGALGNGERVWILAKLPKNILLFKDDIVEQYLLLTNSHDGKGSLLMYFTPIRVVCQNTLLASYKDAKDGISIRHTGNIKDKIDEARRILGLAIDFYKIFETDIGKMAEKKLTLSEANQYFNRVLEIKDENEISTQLTNTKDALHYLFRNGKGNTSEEVKDTVWAGYNAVTEFADHFKTFRKDNRVKSILFGSSAVLKQRAFTEALTLVK
jgi:phage/plasmid-like protein (TIGR03299 family)